MSSATDGRVFFDSTPETAQLDMLAEWLLRWLPKAAATVVPKPRGRPADWKTKIAVVNYLRTIKPPVALSDAPGSRCVRHITDFLKQKGKAANPHTAAELAGTLLAMIQDVKVEPSDFSTS